MLEREPHFNVSNSESSESVSPYRVDLATWDDIEALNRAFPPPSDNLDLHRESLALQEKGERKLFLLKKESRLAGIAILDHNWQSPFQPDIKGPVITGVEIVARDRGKRLVDELLRACEQAAREHGDAKVYLSVDENNTSAIKAYRRNGYEEVPNSRHTLPKDIDPEQIASIYMSKLL